jgi:hypothetical protein
MSPSARFCAAIFLLMLSSRAVPVCAAGQVPASHSSSSSRTVLLSLWQSFTYYLSVLGETTSARYPEDAPQEPTTDSSATPPNPDRGPGWDPWG